jgi:eukaryotic-like serine/threonine-protein kinase
MLIGKELGPFLVEKELGSGAMGTVFRGKNKKTGQRVAIKLMSLALGTSETAVKRFKREVDILKQLDHPNIVKYIISGRYHKAPFYIMEYVEGESLDHILARMTRLPWEEVLRIGMDLCAALQHAHDKGIIHRDLKPSNLMILKDGTTKLTDFGIAKDADVTALTGANSTVGTAAYMSPEQCRGVRDISHKTDLYSMGILFYELLTGRKPFVGETAMEVFLQHANKTDYKRPSEIVMDVPIWVDTLVCQLMEKEPAKRPINANNVSQSLLLIKQKIETQRSAGVDAATKRRIDRSAGDEKLDEEDKAAARAMLGKKKKVKATPFYAKGWFTILALSLVAISASVFIYFAFIKAPDPDYLYSQTQTLLTSDKKAAREGPIADFLRLYPQHEKFARIKAMADDIDFETLDKQMHNRRTSALKFTPSHEEEIFRKALKEEDEGDLAEAAKRWDTLSKKKGDADPDMHAWGLIGERYGVSLKNIDELYRQLKVKAGTEKKGEPTDEFEKLAARAVQNELMSDSAAAKRDWDDLKKKADVPRRWYLLAASRLREMRDVQDEKK